MTSELPDAVVASEVELVGPFEVYDVVVRGRRVPHLTAQPLSGGRVHLLLDNRLGLEVAVADMERIAPFIADSIAVGMGYSCHPMDGWEQPIPRPAFPRLTGIDGLSD